MPAPAAAPPPARYAPIVVHDRRDRSPLTSVAAARGGVPGLPPPGPPTVYARPVPGGRVIQYWLFYRDNPHDRGIVRTGRHEGDWELVQVALGADRRPESVLASQHAGAESCAWSAVDREGTHPVVYVANGSHAGYFRAGTRDRTWPDPNDEAGGNGLRVTPRVQAVSATHPAWMTWPGRWGSSRASWIPGESDSPRGPAHQGVRWEDPEAFARQARPCAADGHPANRLEPAITAGAVLLVALAWLAAARRRRKRRD